MDRCFGVDERWEVSLGRGILPMGLLIWFLPVWGFSAPDCGKYGLQMWDEQVPIGLVVQDLSMHGDFSHLSDQIRQMVYDSLFQEGRLLLLSARPPIDAPTWMSEFAFDYLGWQEAGAWMVLVVQIRPGPRLSVDAYLVEEAEKIALFEGAIGESNLQETFFAVLNGLYDCLLDGFFSFGTPIAYSRRIEPGGAKEIFTVRFGARGQYQASHDGVLALFPEWNRDNVLAWTGYRRNNPDLYLDGHLFSARPGQNTGAAFSPDGRYAAVTLAVDGQVDLYLLDARSGEEVLRLTRARSIDTSPSWSPDGGKIVFVSDRSGSPNLWLMNADGTQQQPLSVPGSYNTSPEWSPDGLQIIYQGRSDGRHFSIYSLDIANHQVVRLTGGYWDDEEPSFSPDGRLIVFTSTRRGSKQLYVMTDRGAHPTLLVDDPGEYFTPAWGYGGR